MNNLIPLTKAQIANETVQAVSARDLHKVLGVRKQFTNWARIYTKKFVKDQDFSPIRVHQKNGYYRGDYLFSVDMAKHVAMMSDTSNSYQVRQYFIECEKQLRQLKDASWLQARMDGKLARRLETDIIKLFVEYAEKQGSVNAHWFYKNFTVGTYRAMFILEKGADWRGLRDHLATLQLNQLATAESIAHKYIMEGMEMGMYYKDIYKYAIAKVEEMARILGKQIPGERVARIGRDA